MRINAAVLWVVGVCAPAAGTPQVTITGGADASGAVYTWVVTNDHPSPIVFVEVPHYHAVLFFAPPRWTTDSTYLVNVGIEDRVGLCRASADAPAAGIVRGTSAEFRMQVSSNGTQRGRRPVHVRFADGGEVEVAGVEVPVPPVTITGGADASGAVYTWTVGCDHPSPVVFVEFPQYHAVLFFAPPRWTTDSTYLVNVGVEDRVGLCRASADAPAAGIVRGTSAEFRMQVSSYGTQRGRRPVRVRFADGGEIDVAGVEVPVPGVTITGGADASGRVYSWKVANGGRSPVIAVEFPHFHAALFSAPTGWTTVSTYLVNVGVPDRPGVCRASAESSAVGIVYGRSAEFRMQVNADGTQRGRGPVRVRFADGAETEVAGVEVPVPIGRADRYMPLIGLGAIAALAFLARAFRNRKRH